MTLDGDVAAKVKALAREKGISFKEAINTLLRAGLAGNRRPSAFEVEAKPLGLRPGIDLDKALRLAGQLSDDETIRKLEARK